MSRYEDRTKDELLELAQERDIEGRSRMTKDELIAALRGETLEPEVEEVVYEEVPIGEQGPLQRAEYYRVQYEMTNEIGDYNLWKQAENEHLASN